MDVLWTVGEDPGADLVGLLGSLDAAAYACVCSWKALAAGGAGLMALLYLLNYYLRVARRPQVVCGGKEYHAVLRKHCPALFQRYWPTIWAYHAHACTVLRPLLQRPPNPPVCYKREVFEFEDGGQAALDWALSPLIPERSPVMLILTGVVGSSSDSYVKHLVNDGLSQGYRPVVFNNRGCGGLPLKTNKTYCASNTEDLAAVVNGIRDAHPGEDIVAVGVSLGGIILMQYLHRTGDSCPLKAVMTASSAWNCTVTNKIMETDFINSLYLRYLASKLKKIVFENAKLATKERLDQLPCSVEELLQCKYISDFDKKLTVPMFGYSSLEEYYQDSSTHNRVHRIKRPLLIITAADDPFVPYKTLPLSPIESNPMTAIAITPRGGHIGFMQGLLPTGPSWLDCVCRQFLRAVQHLTKED